MISKKIAWLFADLYLSKVMEVRSSNFLVKISLVLKNFDIFVYSFLRITQFFILQTLQFSKAKNFNIETIEHIVIESQAPHMHLNYFRLFNKSHKEHTYITIKCFNKYDFTNIAPIYFWDIFAELYAIFLELVFVLNYKTNISKKDLRKKARQELPVFTYFLCLFKIFKARNTNIKLYSGGAFLASAAAIAGGIETSYMAHGLIDRPLTEGEIPSSDTHLVSYPKFKNIYLYSKDEIKYLKEFGVESQFHIYRSTKIMNPIEKIIFFSNPFHTIKQKDALIESIAFFKSKNYEVILKLHPSCTNDLPKCILDDQDIKILHYDGKTASQLIIQESPIFVGSFGSTSLCEALNHDVIPICLCEFEEEISKDVIYPFLKRSIFWRDDQSKIQSYLQKSCNSQRESLLKILKDGL